MHNVTNQMNHFHRRFNQTVLNALMAVAVIALTGLAAQAQVIKVESVGPGNHNPAYATSPGGTGLPGSLKVKISAKFNDAKQRLDIKGYIEKAAEPRNLNDLRKLSFNYDAECNGPGQPTAKYEEQPVAGGVMKVLKIGNFVVREHFKGRDFVWEVIANLTLTDNPVSPDNVRIDYVAIVNPDRGGPGKPRAIKGRLVDATFKPFSILKTEKK